MAHGVNLFDVVAVMQYSKAWLELFRNQALEGAEQIGAWNRHISQKLGGEPIETQIAFCHVCDLNDIDDVFEQSRSIRRLKIALIDYIRFLIKDGVTGERIEAIKTALVMLDAQIKAFEDIKPNARQMTICLDITPALETQMSDAIYLLHEESLNLMKNGLGFEINRPKKL